MNPIPVVLVTGFLGSGKTTLLRRIAEDHPKWHLVFLVNEYAETSVDGETLAETGIPTQSVVGGSLFCECKAGDFVRTMRESVMAEHRLRPLDAVIIETSGTADPEAIGCLMRDHGLADFFEVRRIISVAAPAKLPRLLGNLPVVDAQLSSSDLIILNKIDTVAPDDLDVVEASIRTLNPTAEIIRARHCRFPFSLPTTAPEMPTAPLATCDANPFSTIETRWPRDRPLDEARRWLAGLPDEILRIKGALTTPEGTWHVERTVDGLDIQPGASSSSTLVLIAHDDHLDALESAVRALPEPNPTPLVK